MRPDTCKHFTGITSKTCALGIEYSSVRTPPRPGVGALYPCLNHKGATECPSREFPTEAELAAYEEDLQAIIARVTVQAAAIAEDSAGARGVSGELPCPCCDGGTLRYSVASYNGHVHAACSTPHCGAWNN